MSAGKHLAKGSSAPLLPDDGRLHLYSMRFCPYAHRAHLVLEAKNLPYHVIFINLTEKPEWYSTKNPLNKVPALTLTNEPGAPILCESLIICEYLDEKYPENRLLPQDPLKKAQEKLLVERFNSVIQPLFNVLLFGPETVPGCLTETSENLDIFEKELRDRGTNYFGGDKPGWVDYMIWPWCERIQMLQYLLGDKYVKDDERFKHLLKWRDHMINDLVVKTYYLDGETHAKYIKSRRNNTPDYDMLV